MKGKKIIIGIFGKPGSGKSTLSEALKQELIDWFGIPEQDIRLFAIGDLLRAEVAAKTPFGRKIAQTVERNMLVPQELINPYVKDFLENHPAFITILDGYPRIAGSVVYMLKEMSEEYSLAFIKSSVPDEVAAERLAAYKENRPYIHKQLEEYHEVVSPAWKQIIQAAPQNHYVVDGREDFDRAIRTILRHIQVNAD